MGNSLLLLGSDALLLARKDARYRKSWTQSEHIGYSKCNCMSMIDKGGNYSVPCRLFGVTVGWLICRFSRFPGRRPLGTRHLDLGLASRTVAHPGID